VWNINYAQSVRGMAVVCVGLCVLDVGCKSEPKLKSHIVRGTVVYKGSNQPATKFEGGYVILDPVPHTGNVIAQGTINDEGCFSIGSVIEGKSTPGVMTGEYRVRVVPVGNDATGRANRRMIQPKYMSFDTSGLKLTVTADMKDVILEVEAPK
jgi:hypothetical protein